MNEWADPANSFTGYQTQADVFLALSQGQIDATVVTSTVAHATVNSGNFTNLTVGGDAPYLVDYVSLIGLRQEYGLLNYLNLFVSSRSAPAATPSSTTSGSAKATPPNLTVPGVYY